MQRPMNPRRGGQNGGQTGNQGNRSSTQVSARAQGESLAIARALGDGGRGYPGACCRRSGAGQRTPGCCKAGPLAPDSMYRLSPALPVGHRPPPTSIIARYYLRSSPAICEADAKDWSGSNAPFRAASKLAPERHPESVRAAARRTSASETAGRHAPRRAVSPALRDRS